MIPALSTRIIGATITGVKVVECNGIDEQDRVGTDCSKLLIKLDNGLVLRFWNSEWGGLDILDAGCGLPSESREEDPEDLLDIDIMKG